MKKIKFKPWMMGIIIVVVLLLIIFGAKLLLYLNFLFSNNIVIQTKVSNEDLHLNRGEQSNVSFTISAQRNIFCKAICNYTFLDISQDKIIDKGQFNVTVPVNKEYVIKADKFGDGQILYRFDLECMPGGAITCQGQGKTARNILVTVEYDLSDEEAKLKDKLRARLQETGDLLAELQGKDARINDAISQLSTLIIPVTPYNLKSNVKDFIALQTPWNKQDYLLVNDKLNSININKTAQAIYEYDLVIANQTARYNLLVEKVIGNVNSVDELRYAPLNDNQATEVYKSSKQLLSAINIFKEKNSIDVKETLIPNLTAADLNIKIMQQIKDETLIKTAELNIYERMLCSLNISCKNDFDDLKSSCNEIDTLGSLNYSTVNVNLAALRTNITKKYLAEHNNSRLRYLMNFTVSKNLTVKAQLVAWIPEGCDLVNFAIPRISFTAEKVELQDAVPISTGIEFQEHVSECCVFDKCQECCKTESCIKFPVVFLHGHSFNEKAAAEYSLDAFNGIQKELENDGYLNAGAISLYTPKEFPYGVWGMSGVPISLKASYYFDIFHEPQNYIVVQTKSENIDTYAIRLKELIDTIQFRTGSPKVILITHSMGGLVARRYLQIFGADKIDRLIMIGSPNYGIQGKVSDYCGLTGANNECRDMNYDSLFLNKLNSGTLPKIPITNIVGNGCSMQGGIGDGIVLLKDAELNGTKNFVVNGTCKGIDLLHTSLLDINQHPEVYEIIKVALE